MIVPGEPRGAAFGWRAMGVPLGPAASPLVSGALAAVSMPGAYLVNAALALIGAAVLFFPARDLLRRRK
jgi:MFS family permease